MTVLQDNISLNLLVFLTYRLVKNNIDTKHDLSPLNVFENIQFDNEFKHASFMTYIDTALQHQGEREIYIYKKYIFPFEDEIQFFIRWFESVKFQFYTIYSGKYTIAINIKTCITC